MLANNHPSALRIVEWDKAFNYSSNLDFLTSCIQKTKGDVTQRLCTSTELKFYFEGFFLGNSYERPNRNCNLTTTVSGYGWYQLLAFYGVLKKYVGRVKGSDHNHWNVSLDPTKIVDFDAKTLSIMSTIGGVGVLGRQGHAANLCCCYDKSLSEISGERHEVLLLRDIASYIMGNDYFLLHSKLAIGKGS
ncbi:hypothetical protein L6452_09347 [Arctium lappa]|uniref:Uncharacterized protein n=1 Tax=Arctium lappa TaxID=4217 RepID=A0ACB9DKE6_ARCLA|nr:hypothetical protein L6452_09347 [Arctium lappa]